MLSANLANLARRTPVPLALLPAAGMADFYNGTRTGSGQVSLPLVFRQASTSAWNSLIAIQNVDDVLTTANVKFFRSGETSPALERSADIPASAAVSWDTSTDDF